MAAQFMGDVCSKTGTYNDQNGNQKSRYTKIGSWFQDDQGRISIKMDALPVPQLDQQGRLGCWLSLFHKQDDQQTGNDQFNRQQQTRPQHPRPAANRPPSGNDEVPF